MKYLRQTFSLVLLLMMSFPLFSQQLIGISQNNRIMAAAYMEGRIKETDSFMLKATKRNISKTYFTYRIDIYDLEHHDKINAIRLKQEFRSKMDTLFLSPNGRSLCLIFPGHIIVCDVISGYIVSFFPKSRHAKVSDKKKKKYLQSERTLAFANHDNIFIIAQENRLNAYDSYTGEHLFSYRNAPSNSRINELFFSPNDKYIALLDNNNTVFLWKTGDQRLRKRFFGSEIKFSEDHSKLTIGRKAHNNFAYYVHTLPDLKRIQKFSTYKILREVTSELRLEEKGSGGKINISLPVRILLNHASLSPNGSHLLLPLSGASNENLLLFIDHLSNQISYEIRTHHKEKLQPPYQWINDSLLLIAAANNTKHIYNIREKRMVDILDYQVDQQKNAFNLSQTISLNQVKISPNHSFFVYNNKPFQKYKFFIKASSFKSDASVVEAYEFLSFTPNSKHIICRDKDGKFAILPLLSIAADISGEALPLLTFSDTISSPVETIIGRDGLMPADYIFARFTRMQSFENLTDSLEIKLKTIVQTDSFVEIQFHMLDKNGVYYYGAADEKWKKIWCNLMLRKPNGEVIQVKDFEVIEYNQYDSLPLAFSLVLDHSGSMGTARADLLQSGTISFVSNKAVEDAVSIVKYDHQIKLESKLDNDADRILRSFKVVGLSGYGGGTALLDATAMGVGSLKDARHFSEKVLILFTDGNENSSFSTKRDVILWAMENQVKIHTIGFGDFISEDYLQAISDHTGGSYYRLYHTENLEWILNDIYRKVKNYYSIRFDLEVSGDYILYLKACPPNAVADTLLAKLSFQPDKLRKIRQNMNYNFKTLISENIADEIHAEAFNISDIIDFKDIKIVQHQKSEIIEPVFESEDKSLIEQEFESLIFPDIKFVFDKTDIVKGTDKELINVISFMNKHRDIVIEISGHTDIRGSEEYNIRLSERRAEKVKDLMVKRGIRTDRIITVGYGVSMPVDENLSDRGRQRNRRVEFRIVDGN